MLTTGADPLFLLDYVAANRIELEQVAELVEGAAEVCRAAGCALLGGETAELPGIYREGELDFAGTCVGVVDRDARDRRLARRGRRRRDRLPVGRRARERLHARPRSCSSDEDYDGDDLLAPTRLYLDEVRAPARTRAHALAHVTGGGILGNLAASLPDGLERASTGTRGSGRRCSSWLGRHVDEEELRRVFNLGIGFCAVVRRAPGDGRLVIGRVA